MNQLIRIGALAFAVALAGLAPAQAAPTFPALTGRVVDQAAILSPATEQALDAKLAGLEARTGRQVVVATVTSLQGYEIEDYGYQLGRAWGVGSKEDDDGAVLIVAPKERKVRIEVGYGLEPVLTDALSSVIIQSRIIPKFKAGDLEAGVVDGTDAIIQQLSLPSDQARATATRAVPAKRPSGGDLPIPGVALVIFLFVVVSVLRGFGRRGRRRGGMGSALPWLILGSLANSGGRSRGGSLGGGSWSGGGGGGGFSGGGGSFGGGGSSGSW